MGQNAPEALTHSGTHAASPGARHPFKAPDRFRSGAFVVLEHADPVPLRDAGEWAGLRPGSTTPWRGSWPSTASLHVKDALRPAAPDK